MASSKRRPSKQKRYRENRRVRDARSARSANAGAATAVAHSAGEATAGGGAPTTTDGTGGTGDAGGTGGAATATGTRGRGGWFRRRGRRESPFTVPGQRAVVMAFLFSLVSAVMIFVAPFPFEREVPPDDPRVEEEFDDEAPEPNEDGTVTITEDERLLDEVGIGPTTAYAVIPIAITGAALAFTHRPQRSMAWTMAMIALAAYTFFVGGLATYAVVPMIALAVGGFQTRRAEQKERMAQIRAQREQQGEAPPRGDVIDVDAVEETDDDTSAR